MNDSNRKNELFEMIGAVSFAIDDLRLYLDTHPDDAEALALFTEYRDQRHQLVAEYTRDYGSIASYYPDTSRGWTWNS